MEESKKDPRVANSQSIFSLAVRGAVRVIALLAATAILLSLLGFLARLWWPLELMCHFRIQYAAALALAAPLLWLGKQRAWTIVALLAAALNAACLLPFYWPLHSPAVEGRGALRILSANVHTSNRRSELLMALIEEQSPDVIVVMEIDDRWLGELAELRTKYPFARLEPRGGNFGMALYSRRPLRHVRTIPLGGIDTPAITATVETAEGDVSLLAIHPLPPVGAKNSHLRNLQLGEAARLADEQTHPCVLVGDLNVTPFSPYFRNLLREGNLRDARCGCGLLPTWPLQFPSPLLRIPIDHCLVGEGVQVRRFTTAGDVGSDHAPILVDVSLPGP